MKCPLYIATYWVAWNTWTLVPDSAFTIDANRAILDLASAMQFNEMWSLGDLSVGTRFPLRLRLIVDKTKPRAIDENGVASFTIGSVELYCKDFEITQADEQRIATYLMLYGTWREENEVLTDGTTVDSVEFRLVPLRDNKQGFEIIGSLSEMFSSFYRQAIVQEGQVGQIKVDVSPGSLGQLIPQDYKGDALPLWRFILKPGSGAEKA